MVEVGTLSLLRLLCTVGALATRAHKVQDSTPGWYDSSLADLWQETAMTIGIRCIRPDSMWWLQQCVVVEC